MNFVGCPAIAPTGITNLEGRGRVPLFARSQRLKIQFSIDLQFGSRVVFARRNRRPRAGQLDLAAYKPAKKRLTQSKLTEK